MEALLSPVAAEQCNISRRVPADVQGYLSQPEMREFAQSALDAGWRLISYEADPIQWLSTRHHIEISNPHDLQEIQSVLQTHQAEITSMEFNNWREEQQARNLIEALESLPANTPLLVWCGNSHQSKRPLQGWIPMGYRFKEISGMDPFSIDQTRSVNFADDPYHFEPFEGFTQDLMTHGGTAGFLLQEAPPTFMHNTDADAYLLSLYNEME
jgi:hypothetical protein